MTNQLPKTPGEPVDYATPSNQKSPVVFRMLVIVAMIAVVVALTMALLPRFNDRNRGIDPQGKCASNLRQIGQAILLYTNDSHGRLPDTLGELLLTEDIESSVFICPCSNDTRAEGATTQAVVSNLNSPGHLSYIYLGKGKTLPLPPNEVVVYEPIANHQGKGMNVLFGDGRVQFLYPSQAQAIVDQANAGSSTVLFPSTQTASHQ